MRWILGKTKLFNAKCGKTGKNSVIIRSTSFIIISKTKSSKCFFTSLTALFLISNFRIKSLAKSIPKIVLFMFLCYSTVSLLKHFLTSSSNPVILSDPSLTLAIWSFLLLLLGFKWIFKFLVDIVVVVGKQKCFEAVCPWLSAH